MVLINCCFFYCLFIFLWIWTSECSLDLLTLISVRPTISSPCNHKKRKPQDSLGHFSTRDLFKREHHIPLLRFSASVKKHFLVLSFLCCESAAVSQNNDCTKEACEAVFHMLSFLFSHISCDLRKYFHCYLTCWTKNIYKISLMKASFLKKPVLELQK